jgi:hypothetical protein
MVFLRVVMRAALAPHLALVRAGMTAPVPLLAVGFLLEALLGFLHIAAGLVERRVGDILVARDVLSEPVVDGAVLRFLDLAGVLVGAGHRDLLDLRVVGPFPETAPPTTRAKAMPVRRNRSPRFVMMADVASGEQG